MKEWYLIDNGSPNSIGGYENQAFLDYKNDAFSESLTTDIADDLILYNYDLSVATPFRGIIEGNLADTQLKSMERTILVPVGFLHSGDYVFFENEYWIVDGRPGNNKIFEKATLKECQYKLRWQKDNGDVVERWANLVSASKYDIGESGNKTIILTTNNYTITMPNDDDSQTIEGKRVFIDHKKVPEKVFKITRNDDVLYLHGEHGGTLSLIADKVEFNTERDNQELRLCDYYAPSKPEIIQPNQGQILSRIIGRNEIRLGYEMEYVVEFLDENDNSVSSSTLSFSWNIDDNGLPGINYSSISEDRTKIRLLITDEDLAYESFKLQVILNSIISNEIEITIVD